MVGSKMTNLCYVIILTHALMGCNKNDKQLELYESIHLHPKVFYVETKNFSNVLQNCFGNKLLNHWTANDFTLKSLETAYYGNTIFQKHEFLDISKFSAGEQPVRFEKITLTLKDEINFKNTTYTIERFRYENNGTWRRIGNLGDFKTFNRLDDELSPEQLDVNELCNRIVEKTILASYK